MAEEENEQGEPVSEFKQKVAKRARAERRRKLTLTTLGLLLFGLVATWFLWGERFLPAEYTFPNLWQRIRQVWNSPPPAPPTPPPPSPPPVPPALPEVHPADKATASERANIKAFLALLEKACTVKPPLQAVEGLEKRMQKAVGSRILQGLIFADSAYAKAQKKLEDMNARNEKLHKKRGEELAAPHRRYINEYSAKELTRQQNRIEELETASKKSRADAVKRAIEAVKTTTAKWTGPESKRDAAQFKSRLDALAKKLNDK